MAYHRRGVCVCSCDRTRSRVALACSLSAQGLVVVFRVPYRGLCCGCRFLLRDARDPTTGAMRRYAVLLLVPGCVGALVFGYVGGRLTGRLSGPAWTRGVAAKPPAPAAQRRAVKQHYYQAGTTRRSRGLTQWLSPTLSVLSPCLVGRDPKPREGSGSSAGTSSAAPPSTLTARSAHPSHPSASRSSYRRSCGQLCFGSAEANLSATSREGQSRRSTYFSRPPCLPSPRRFAHSYGRAFVMLQAAGRRGQHAHDSQRVA